MKRKVGVTFYNGQLGIVEEEMPELQDHQVLVEVHCSLISPGTELATAKKYRKEPGKETTEPFKFGYSNAGIIREVKGDCKGLKAGMRVACMGTDAKHTDFAAVPVNLVVPLPDDVSFEQGAFLSLGATSLQAVRRTGVKLGEYGAVLGQGIVGNLASQLYRIHGARVIGWETMEIRRIIAKQCSFETVDFMNEDPVERTKAFADPYGLDFALFAFGGDGEKAFADINGAYPMINREFARYIRQKHPNIKYLDREEDMGSEGLRKAKRSYYPHHMIEKCWAHYSEDQI